MRLSAPELSAGTLAEHEVFRTSMGVLYCGDATNVLAKMDASSVDCIFGSPPYFSVRDYGIEGQIGLEPSVDEYIRALCEPYDAAARVLKPSGSCWVVIGDMYIEKGLQLVPARFAMEMIRRGWILRNDVIWRKTRTMPHPVKDRLLNVHEHIYHFVRGNKYYYDLDSIRQPHKESSLKRVQSRINVSHNGRYGEDAGNRGRTFEALDETSAIHEKGRNPGDVFDACPSNSANGHFATFPRSIVEPRILSTCPPGGVVMDFWMGSGTTARVAEELRRHWIGIELNPEYCVIVPQTLAHTQLGLLHG